MQIKLYQIGAILSLLQCKDMAELLYNPCSSRAPVHVEQLLHVLVGRGSTLRQRTDRGSPCLTSLGMVMQQVSA